MEGRANFNLGAYSGFVVGIALTSMVTRSDIMATVAVVLATALFAYVVTWNYLERKELKREAKQKGQG